MKALFASSKLVVQICCYGLFGAQYRTAIEMIGLKLYFERCAEYIASLWKQGRLAGVILCGGRTNPNYPDVSEAETSLRYLLKVLREKHGMELNPADCYLEDRSKNTPQNLHFALLLKQTVWHTIGNYPAVMVCDTCRVLKIRALLWQLKRSYHPSLRAQVMGFPRQDVGNPLRIWCKQIMAAIWYRLSAKKVWGDLVA